jgi:hypothetical protein
MPRGPLHVAAERGDPGRVREEIARDRSQLDAMTPGYNETPLHRAAENGHGAVIQELRQARADVNARRCGGYTALHLAHSPEVANMLLAVGIDPTIACRKGFTAAESRVGGSSVWSFIEEHRLGQVIFRMQNRRLAAALAGWASHAQQLRRLKVAAARVVERMHHSASTSAFDQWTRVSRMQSLLRRAAVHLARRIIASAFHAWLDAWRSERVQAEHEARLAVLRADEQSELAAATESKQALQQAHADAMAWVRREHATEMEEAFDAAQQGLYIYDVAQEALGELERGSMTAQARLSEQHILVAVTTRLRPRLSRADLRWLSPMPFPTHPIATAKPATTRMAGVATRSTAR